VRRSFRKHDDYRRPPKKIAGHLPKELQPILGTPIPDTS